MDLKSPLYDAAKGGKWNGQLPHAEIAAQSPQAKRPATPTLPGKALKGFEGPLRAATGGFWSKLSTPRRDSF